jgi:hypothetical protein
VKPGECADLAAGCDVLAPSGTLDVAFGDLPGNAAAIGAALDKREPEGSTPLGKPSRRR